VNELAEIVVANYFNSLLTMKFILIVVYLSVKCEGPIVYITHTFTCYLAIGTTLYNYLFLEIKFKPSVMAAMKTNILSHVASRQYKVINLKSFSYTDTIFLNKY
jgi:hypothetical protein